MLVGGGTSIMPRVAPALYEFVELDNGDYLKIAEAVFRIFDRQDWLRVNRARARIKVFVDKFGIDELRRQVEEELQGDWVAERDFSIEGRLFLDDEREGAPAPPATYGSPNGDLSEFERFRAANVRAQKQEGFVTVETKVVRGDLTPEQFRGLAQVMRTYAGGYARTTVQQNFVLRWVREESVYDVWRALSELGLGDAGSREINDVVSCPGTDSCKLGITSSMGLNQAIEERIEAMEITDPLTRAIHIKMSGCPNGCGQHHLGAIGFYGASIKVGEHTIPAYIPHVGGVFEGGEVQFGQRLKQRLPAKRVPDAVERWIRHYEATRTEGEEWGAFVERVGTPELEGARQGPLAAGRLRPGDDGPVHRLEPRRALPGDPRRGRVRGLSDITRTVVSQPTAPDGDAGDAAAELTATLREAVERHGGGAGAAVLLPEGGVGADRRAAADRRRTRRADRDDRHGRAVRGDAADVAGLRGALRHRGRGAGRERRRGRRLERPGALLLAGEGRGAGARARRRRGLDHGHPPRAGPDARGRAADRTRRGAGHLEVQPAGVLDGEGPVAADPRARAAPTTRFTTRATLRSAARRARSRAAAARAAGRAPRRPSAACTWRASDCKSSEVRMYFDAGWTS